MTTPNMQQMQTRADLFATPQGERLLTDMDAPGFVRTMLKVDLPWALGRVAELEAVLRDIHGYRNEGSHQPVHILGHILAVDIPTAIEAVLPDLKPAPKKEW